MPRISHLFFLIPFSTLLPFEILYSFETYSIVEYRRVHEKHNYVSLNLTQLTITLTLTENSTRTGTTILLY